MNPAAEELLHLPRTRALGRPCERVFAGSPALAAGVRQARQQSETELRAEEELSCRETAIPVRTAYLPLMDRTGNTKGTVLVIHDLRSKKALEAAVRRHEHLARLGTLVAGLAHEVKNPLAGIQGAAQLLEQRLADRQLREYTAIIVKETGRLSDLVQSLLALGKQPAPRLAPVNIHRAIREVLAIEEVQFAARGICVRCEFDPSLPEVRGDEAQLRQVLLNLLKNAAEAMDLLPQAAGKDGEIVIRTRMETDFRIVQSRRRVRKFLRVEFADEGIGIDPLHAARAFEPFFTTKAAGSGLGLAICSRIIADHGGTIEIAPNRPRGAVATITLPVT